MSDPEAEPRNRFERHATAAARSRSSVPDPPARLQQGHEPPLAVPMPQAPRWLGISRSKIYQEIAIGRLRAVKCGSKTLIPYESGQAWLNNLPPAERAPFDAKVAERSPP